MIVIVSNRSVEPPSKNHLVFGEASNRKGLNELRVATAQFAAGRWKVELLGEKQSDVNRGNPPSRRIFVEIMQKIAKGEISQTWLFWIHGFNTSFEKNLEQCRTLEELYGVNVLAFSWPSNQGGSIKREYRRARAAAKGSVNALDRVMEKLEYYLARNPFAEQCQVQLTLMAFSMGNHVLELFIRDPVFTDEVQIFRNVILTQADVDVGSHAAWLNHMMLGKRVYVTINEVDWVLGKSDLINKARLGNTVKSLNASGTVYFDFTGGLHVGNTHDIYDDTALKNDVVREIFQRAVTGDRAETVDGIQFDSDTNTWRLTELEPVPENGNGQ